MHFLRDLRGHVRCDQHDALSAIIRQVFTVPDGDEVRRRLRDAVAQLERRLPKVAARLEDEHRARTRIGSVGRAPRAGAAWRSTERSEPWRPLRPQRRPSSF